MAAFLAWIACAAWMLTLALSLAGAEAVATPSPQPPSEPARTIGDLVERAERGWERVETVRTRTVIVEGDAGADGTPTSDVSAQATPSGEVLAITVQEVILPDRKRVRQLTGDGEVTQETIVVDGRVFMRFGAEGDMTAWSEVDYAEIEPDSPVGIGIRALLMPVEAPFALVPPEIQALPVVHTDTVAHDRRSCEVYRLSPFLLDDELLGDRVPVDLTVAITAEGVVCWTEQRTERFVIRTTLEMVNEPLTIEIPDDVAPLGTLADL